MNIYVVVIIFQMLYHMFYIVLANWILIIFQDDINGVIQDIPLSSLILLPQNSYCIFIASLEIIILDFKLDC